MLRDAAQEIAEPVISYPGDPDGILDWTERVFGFGAQTIALRPLTDAQTSALTAERTNAVMSSRAPGIAR